MAGTELAYHYLLVVLGLSIFSYLVYAFTQEASDLIPIVKNFFLKIGPTFANPLAYMRVTIIVPLFTPLSMRVLKRFFIKYGFKMIFMFAFLIYFMNVWSESLSDDPFTIVGVSPSADAKAIRKACRRGSLALHPDKHPGREDEIRPQFEKHTRACKVLNDPKLKDKYIKWGTLPKAGETGGEQQVATGTSVLAVGGGSYLLSMSFYFLFFVGLPSTVAYYCIDMLYEEEQLLTKIAGESTQLSNEMISLYGYPRFASMFLDVAELYLTVASAELADLKNTVASLNPAGGRKLDSLLNLHHARVALWMQYSDLKKEDEDAYKLKCEKVDAQIKVATEAIGTLERKARSGKKDR